MEQYLNIPGSEKVLDLYGDWPSFHDAEIVSVFLDRGKGKGKFGPTISVKVHCFTMTSEITEKGKYKTINHALLSFQFYDVVEFFFENGFGTQNPLSGMFIKDIRSSQLEDVNYEVGFGAHFNCDIEFKCASIVVSSLERGTPDDSICA